MKRRYKILGGITLVLGVAVVGFGLWLSHESPCPSAQQAEAGASTMQAWKSRCYGGPEVLTYEVTPKPVPADDEILVKVRAAGVNPLDWHVMRGKPYIMRLGGGTGAPKEADIGVDFAGIVESVGKSVTSFKPGDEVFGARNGAFAEYLKVRADRNVVIKPPNISFAEAAAVPVAAITALQAVRDKGQLKPGQKVLVNGASGGVGTYAVQIAKAMGAEVTGVCSARNAELVRSLGADHVIDYTKENFTVGERKYDLIVDNVATQPLSDVRKVMNPDAHFVLVGSLDDGAFLGPVKDLLKALVYDKFVSQSFLGMLSELKPGDLQLLAEMLADGRLKSSIDKAMPMSELPEAIRYVESGRARGKVVVTHD